MSTHLFIGQVDYIKWADRANLQNAVLVAGAGVVETFNVQLQNFVMRQDAGVLPALPAGHVPILYISVAGDGPDVAPYADYEVRFSGVLVSVDGTDPSPFGATTLMVATPTKPLKQIRHSTVFFAPPTGPLTDTGRLHEFARKVQGELPDWDLETYVAAADHGNITYGPYHWPPHNDGTDVDLFSDLPELSIEDIIRAVASDPGWFFDAGYPCQARNWWVEGDFKIHGDPTSGVTWYFHYQNVPVPGDTIFDFVDQPDPMADPTTYDTYDTGAKYTLDYSMVVRQINVAGPSQDTGGNSFSAQPIYWLTESTVGRDPTDLRTSARPGIIFKSGGADGVWNAGRVSFVPNWDDWEVSAQAQEVYLEHDTFQRPDSVNGLGASAMGGLWEDSHNIADHISDTPMCIQNQLAVPQHQPGRDGAHINFSIMDTHASTCIIRTHFARVRKGQALLFRYVDIYNYWMVRADTDGYHLIKRTSGGDTVAGSVITTPADMDEIKISMLNFGDSGPYQIQAFLNSVLFHQVDNDSFGWDSTKAGFSVDCDYGAGANPQDAAFYDFQVTNFWGDRAFGMGDNDFSALTNPSWINISFGFVLNSDASVDLCKSGDLLGSDEWEPGMYTDENRHYLYNDRFKVLTAKYMDPVTASLQRLVQWLKQPGGQGEWLLLAEYKPVTVPALTVTNSWRVQFAGKERGAALSDVVQNRTISNLFVALSPPYSPIYGTPAHYPASGLLQSDQLDTYRKRQAVADGVFKAEAEPAITFTAVTKHHFVRGDFARIRCGRAGWTVTGQLFDSDGIPLVESGGGGPIVGGPDTRPILMCSSSQRVETGNLKQPRYNVKFGRYVYASQDPGRTHLLRPFTQIKVMPTNLELPTWDGASLVWDEQAAYGLMNYGQRIEAQIIPADVQGWQNQTWPTISFDMPTASAFIPPSQLPSSGKFLVRYRTNGTGGPSDWSAAIPFISPPGVPPNRLSTLMLQVGNGVDPLTSTEPGCFSGEAVVNQECKIVGWSASLEGVVGDVTFHVERCTAMQHRVDGMAAYTNITGGTVPNVNSTFNDGSFNDGYSMQGWDAAAFDLHTNDWLRIRIVLAATAAVQGTVALMFEANAVVDKKVGGTPTG